MQQIFKISKAIITGFKINNRIADKRITFVGKPDILLKTWKRTQHNETFKLFAYIALISANKRTIGAIV